MIEDLYIIRIENPASHVSFRGKRSLIAVTGEGEFQPSLQ